jgi:hypothetical protein
MLTDMFINIIDINKIILIMLSKQNTQKNKKNKNCLIKSMSKFKINNNSYFN